MPFSGRDTSDGSRYEWKKSLHFLFHWLREFAEAPKGASSGFICFSPLRYSTDFAGQPHLCGRHILKRRENALRCRAYSSRAGILTCFPFGALLLGCVLGSPNPQLNRPSRPTGLLMQSTLAVNSLIIAEEPWPIRRLGFSPSLAVTTDKILVPARSV